MQAVARVRWQNKLKKTSLVNATYLKNSGHEPIDTVR